MSTEPIPTLLNARFPESYVGVEPAEMPFIAELDDTGDSRTQWDPADPEQVAKAQAKFDEYKKNGFLVYKVDAKGKQAEVLSAFDPTAERIIASKPMVGG